MSQVRLRSRVVTIASPALLAFENVTYLCRSRSLTATRQVEGNLERFAGVAQWQSPSLPSWSCGFDSRRPLSEAVQVRAHDRPGWLFVRQQVIARFTDSACVGVGRSKGPGAIQRVPRVSDCRGVEGSLGRRHTDRGRPFYRQRKAPLGGRLFSRLVLLRSPTHIRQQVVVSLLDQGGTKTPRGWIGLPAGICEPSKYERGVAVHAQGGNELRLPFEIMTRIAVKPV
jgi:hypothetical protein